MSLAPAGFGRIARPAWSCLALAYRHDRRVGGVQMRAALICLGDFMTLRTLFAAAAGASFALCAVPSASALGTDDYVGSIGMTAAPFCPRGTIEPTGQVLEIRQNTALFSLLGTTYGGDGKSTFALPDLRDATPPNGMRFCIVMQGIFPAKE